MASKANEKTIRKDDDWKGYVNWSPSTSDKESVVRLFESGKWRMDDALAQFVESGYSVAFGWDKVGKCIRLSITGKDRPCPNIGYTLSIRGSTPERCLGLAYHYNWIICGAGDWLIDKKGEEVW